MANTTLSTFQKWEYAELERLKGRDPAGFVTFSHRRTRTGNYGDLSGNFWELMKQLGNEGWEMVGVAGKDYSGNETWRYVFKRRIQ